MDDKEKQRRDRIISRLCADAGGDRPHHTYRFSTWKTNNGRQRQALEMVREWATSWEDRKQLGEGLVLYGRPSTGKSHLAFSAAGSIVSGHGDSAKWVNCRDLVSKARDLISLDGLEADFVRPMVDAELLVLDDALPVRGELTPSQTDLLYRISERRSSSRRPTIVTLNASNRDDAARRAGGPIWDRWIYGAWVIHFDWDSYRQPTREM